MQLPRLLSLLCFSILCLMSTMGDSFAADPVIFVPAADNGIQLPEGLTLGPCSAVDFDSEGRMYLFHRGKQPILCFDRAGRFLRSWGDNLIGQAHGLRVDQHDHIWVTDIGNHMVYQFDSTGKILLAIGQPGKPGTGENQFDKPTDIAFGRHDEIYISDGYGNSRVMKFAANGKYLGQWGESGKGPGQFNLPHSIILDRQGRILVGDRENNRVQAFNSEGKLLEIWTGFAPYGMEFDAQGNLFVADGRANKVLLLNSSGKVAQSWGRKGAGPGEFNLPHMLTADTAGNLFIAEIGGKRLQKLLREK